MQQAVNAIALGGLYLLFSVGYTLQFGILHVFNIAHASLYMVAAVILLLLTADGISVYLAATVAILIAGIGGVVIERVAVRPIRRRGGGILPTFVATIAVGTIVTIGVQAPFGGNIRYLPQGLIPSGRLDIGVATITWIQLFTIVVAVAAYIGLLWLDRRTRYGRAMRAVAENPQYAERTGISTNWVYTFVFFISSCLAGVAGVLGALTFSSVYTGMHIPLELRGFAIIVLGGLGSVRGAALGAFILAAGEVAAVHYGGSLAREIVPFAVLFLVLVLRPQGLMGRIYRQV